MQNLHSMHLSVSFDPSSKQYIATAQPQRHVGGGGTKIYSAIDTKQGSLEEMVKVINDWKVMYRATHKDILGNAVHCYMFFGIRDVPVMHSCKDGETALEMQAGFYRDFRECYPRKKFNYWTVV